MSEDTMLVLLTQGDYSDYHINRLVRVPVTTYEKPYALLAQLRKERAEAVKAYSATGKSVYTGLAGREIRIHWEKRISAAQETLRDAVARDGVTVDHAEVWVSG